MLFSRSLVVLVSAISGIVAAQNNSYLTVTSLVTNAQNNSALECWKFTTPLTVPSTPGISGSMLYAFNLSTANEYTVIPARFDGGIHNAPAPQFVYFTSGLAHISLPHGDDEAWILGGANGLIFAGDTTGTGHATTYPSDQATVALALPVEGGKPPPYAVLHQGPCEHGATQIVSGA
ncbi:hypothetical protein IWZ00DRAFT_299956 [Phyllosticta capitalensis]|uniref:uncharacterized protein n=1 Tax=Phyllosticta capitalensis TaxID=121624 RepID=UPI003130C31E